MARSAATTMAATTAGGHISAAAHHTPPTAAPMAAPTTGNHRNVARSGAALVPSGVRNAIARRSPLIGRAAHN